MLVSFVETFLSTRLKGGMFDERFFSFIELGTFQDIFVVIKTILKRKKEFKGKEAAFVSHQSVSDGGIAICICEQYRVVLHCIFNAAG